MEQASCLGLTERVITLFTLTMFQIGDDKQRFVEKYLFGFGLADSVLVRALARIARVPVEAFNTIPVYHERI